MRNWNLWNLTEIIDNEIASRLPMRNWNWPAVPNNSRSIDRFQTTYEELKLLRVSLVNSQIKSFQTTYEELKPLYVAALFHVPLRFQTTYEELKPGYSKAADLNSRRLPDYLWGIETLEQWVYFPSPDETGLPDYLWGIETGSAVENQAIRAFRFQTTYEELKPPPLGFSEASRELPDYLWGIETLGIQ